MPDRYLRSRVQNQRASQSLARGVATAFRASQQPVPITFSGGHGPLVRDIDGNEYVDYALAYGPLLLGHSPKPVLAAVRRQLDTGLGYGACHELEAQLAEAICRTVPSAELCVFSCSGSEAVHAALRIARSATGRTRVLKFLGHFHGWLDPVAVGVPGFRDASPATGGQDPLASSAVVVCPWNDIDALERVLDPTVAAVIMEPVAVNGGCLLPAPGYLEAVRELTRRNGTLLVFDEVITGFRLALGGAQQYYGVLPDLTILGKALGAGFPISAVCGSAEVLAEVAAGRVAHIGTMNANPVCASAALAAVETLERHAAEVYPHLDEMGDAFARILREEAAAHDLPLVVNQFGAAAYAFWTEGPVESYEDTLRANAPAYRNFAEALLDEGVHVIPRGLLYVSTAHDSDELEQTRQAVRRASARMAKVVPA